jgi:hypothetical protein
MMGTPSGLRPAGADDPERDMQTTGRIIERFRVHHLAAVLMLVLTASCASVGPKTIPRDQFDYGQAIANAWKEQLLLNMVGLRYVEAPVFVNVSSVINQYSLEGEVALGAGANSSISGANTLTLGGAGRYADRPTITYTPIAGQQFARSLLTPIPPESLFALVQSGWPPEVILRLAVRSMNGIDNEWASPAQRKQADPRFVELMRVWGRLRKARVLGLRREEPEGSEGKKGRARIVVYQTATAATPETIDDLRFLQEALDLDPEVKEYTLSYGLVPDEDNEIMVMTSSILEIINELAWRIYVPSHHVEEGRTGSTFETAEAGTAPLIRVHYSAEKPEDSYVTVRMRDHWFYIDDRDVNSKRTFAIVQIVLSLTDSGETARGPVVSITN